MNTIQHNIKLICFLPSLFWAFSTLVQADSAKLFNPANNHTYQRFDSYKSWTNAQAACVAQGGYLVTITSQAENDWLKTSLVDVATDDIWLGTTGGVTTGQWQWITGEAWSYVNWNTVTSLIKGDHAYIRSYDNARWDNYAFVTSLFYICEWNKAFKTYTSMITADTDNNGSSEFIFIGNNGTTVKIFGYDRVSKAVVSDVSFLAYPTYSGVSLSVVDDMNGNGYKEFALLMTKKSDGSSVIQTRDSKTGKVIETYNVPR